jgi:hypothetical protein
VTPDHKYVTAVDSHQNCYEFKIPSSGKPSFTLVENQDYYVHKKEDYYQDKEGFYRFQIETKSGNKKMSDNMFYI